MRKDSGDEGGKAEDTLPKFMDETAVAKMEEGGEKRTNKETFIETADSISSVSVGDDVLIKENIKDNTPDEIEEINEEAGDGVRESDNNKGKDEFGEGHLNIDGSLRVNFDAEHNHEAINDETKNKDEVRDISEGFPDRENG